MSNNDFNPLDTLFTNHLKKGKKYMHKIRKVFKFEAAHILESSFTEEYQNIHGHSYEVEVILSSEKLNKDGMVCDFGEVKHLINDIFVSFDHALIVPKSIYPKLGLGCFKSVILVSWNPTAENMAKFFYDEIKSRHKLNDYMINVYEVIVHETKTDWASYKESN